MDKDFTCALCLEFESDTPDTDYFVSTECGHIFHYQCLRLSYDTGYKDCPMDRKQIDMEKLRKLFASEVRGRRGTPNFSNYQASPSKDFLAAPEDVEYDYKFKIIIVGDPAVGKSCLLQRYADDIFSTNIFATVGCDWRSKTIKIGGKVVNLSIWDTVGQEKYKSLVTNYVREAHGALLVYDITRQDSIEHLEDWNEFVKDHALPDTVRILIGNKTDLEQHRVVPKIAGKKLAAKLDAPFFETSAKDAYNVEAAFRLLAAKILDNSNLIKNVELKMKNPNISLNRTKDQTDERIMSHMCSQSWQWTKSGWSGTVKGIKTGWDFVTGKREREGNNDQF